MQQYPTVFKQSFQTTTCMVQIILFCMCSSVMWGREPANTFFTQTQLKQNPTPMEVLVLLLVCYHNSDNKLSTVRLVAYLIMCYEWLLNKKWLFCVCDFHQRSRLSFWHQRTNKHTHMYLDHDITQTFSAEGSNVHLSFNTYLFRHCLWCSQTLPLSQEECTFPLSGSVCSWVRGQSWRPWPGL